MNATEAGARAGAITVRLSEKHNFPYRAGVNFEGAICDALLDGVAPEAVEKLMNDVLDQVAVYQGEICVQF